MLLYLKKLKILVITKNNLKVFSLFKFNSNSYNREKENFLQITGRQLFGNGTDEKLDTYTN